MDNTKIENTIQELVNIQSQCQELINRIREIEKEIEPDDGPKFKRVENGEHYSMVGIVSGRAVCDVTYEGYWAIDGVRFNNNNYFKTSERAQEVADKINFLLKLERFHDTFCPDYEPNWNDSESEKWYVFFDHIIGHYNVSCVFRVQDETIVYFPSEEIAQKVCYILNKENPNGI